MIEAIIEMLIGCKSYERAREILEQQKDKIKTYDKYDAELKKLEAKQREVKYGL